MTRVTPCNQLKFFREVCTVALVSLVAGVSIFSMCQATPPPLLSSYKGVVNVDEDVGVLVYATGVDRFCVNVRIGVVEPGGRDIEG